MRMRVEHRVPYHINAKAEAHRHQEGLSTLQPHSRHSGLLLTSGLANWSKSCCIHGGPLGSLHEPPTSLAYLGCSAPFLLMQCGQVSPERLQNTHYWGEGLSHYHSAINTMWLIKGPHTSEFYLEGKQRKKESLRPARLVLYAAEADMGEGHLNCVLAGAQKDS